MIERDEDVVDMILEQWRRERPDLDTSPMDVIGRISRVGHLLETELRAVFATFDLGEGEFDVLATLRRAGADAELSPSELTAAMMVTSGAVTKRVDRLVAAGLVRRRDIVEDGRARRIRLTPEGRVHIDRALEAHVANEERLLAGLTATERTQLAQLLRRLTQSIPPR